jgi:hypothetical protein
MHNYCLGTAIYAVKHDVPKNEHGLTQILKKNKQPFDDLSDTFKHRQISQLNT